MSEIYEKFFQFNGRPFAAQPRVERYYPGAAAEAVRTAAARCIQRAEGFAVILGASGSGKTLQCQVLAEQFRNTMSPVLMLGGEVDSARALLQKILFELGLPFKRRNEGELRLTLMERLASENDPSEGLLLLVDEAQSLKPKLFEELRLLSNLVRKGKSRVRLVLAGGSLLEERLAHPKLTAFAQRVAVRATLHPFSPAETQEYVRAQTAVVGGDPDTIWGDDALLAVHEFSDGVPRLINQVCDHALLLAAMGGTARIDAAGIEEAWADLQQIPLPGVTRNTAPSAARKPAKSEVVIEFGSLDDDLPAAPERVNQGSAAERAAETEIELVFDEDAAATPAVDVLPVPARDLPSSAAPSAGTTQALAGTGTVYDDFPIVASGKPRLAEDASPIDNWDAVPARPPAQSESVDDWVPVPMMEVPLAIGPQCIDKRKDLEVDPVQPEFFDAPQVVPIRGLADAPFSSKPVLEHDDEYAADVPRASPTLENAADDVVLEEDVVLVEEEVPLPAFARRGERGVATATLTPPRRGQSEAVQRRSAPVKQRRFSQLFTQLSKS